MHYQIEVHERDCAIHHFFDERFLKLKISNVLQDVSFAVSDGVKERVKQVTISALCPPCEKRVQERGNGKKIGCTHALALALLSRPSSLAQMHLKLALVDIVRGRLSKQVHQEHCHAVPMRACRKGRIDFILTSAYF